MKAAVFTRVTGEGFRIFFLAARLFSTVIAMAVWEGWLAVHAAGGIVATTPFSPGAASLARA